MVAVKGRQRALICTHDNPDPDSIASAFALGRLLEAKCDIPYVLAYGGVLGRAENRAMVRLLRVPLQHLSRVNLDDFDVVGLVDTQFEAGNHSLPLSDLTGKASICIDHHPSRAQTHPAAFSDVGGDYGATSTVLTSYLHAADVTPNCALATSLFYGIKSDTRDLGREACADDVKAYSELVALTDMAMLSAIEHPRLPRAYFSVLMRAFQDAMVQGNVVCCDLGKIYIPDLVPETADRLVAAEGMRWAVIVGEFDGNVYVSLRVNDRRYSAGKLVRDVVGKHFSDGSAGGHGTMAGARIPYGARTETDGGKKRMRKKLLKLLVEATGVDLSAKKEVFATTAHEAAEPGIAQRMRPRKCDDARKVKSIDDVVKAKVARR